MHLLLIEDEPKLARYVAQALHKGGCTVDISSDGASGLQRALEARHDAVVLDLTLPGCDGLEILRELRSRQHTVPVLILSARGKPAERVEGLELGADDYLAKPFVMEELLARLRSLKRRASIPHTPPLVASDLIFHSATKTATRGGDKLDLSAREAALLEYLLRHANRVARGRDYSLSDFSSRAVERLPQPAGPEERLDKVSTRAAAERKCGFGEAMRRAPYIACSLLVVIAAYMAWHGWQGLAGAEGHL